MTAAPATAAHAACGWYPAKCRAAKARAGHRSCLSVPDRRRCGDRDWPAVWCSHRRRRAEFIASVVARGDGSRHQDGPRAALSCGAICAGALQRLSEPSLQYHPSLCAAIRTAAPSGSMSGALKDGRVTSSLGKRIKPGHRVNADRALWLGAFPARSRTPADSRRHQHRLCADLVDRRRGAAREPGAQR